MGIITWIQGVWKRMFRSDVEKVFGTDALVSEVMEAWITKYDRITEGKPEWQNPDDQVGSINFAKYIDDVTAGLVTLDLGIALSGSARADWLQKQTDYVLSAITDKTSEALGNVGIMFKPNGQNVDYIEPGCFFPTATNSNGDVLGCIFVTRLQKGKKWYSRFEWHRFEESGEGNLYAIGQTARGRNVVYRKSQSGACYSQMSISGIWRNRCMLILRILLQIRLIVAAVWEYQFGITA